MHLLHVACFSGMSSTVGSHLLGWHGTSRYFILRHMVRLVISFYITCAVDPRERQFELDFQRRICGPLEPQGLPNIHSLLSCPLTCHSVGSVFHVDGFWNQMLQVPCPS
jgi:hypothetical protein